MKELQELCVWIALAITIGANIALKPFGLAWFELLQLIPSAPAAFMGIASIPAEWAVATDEQEKALIVAVDQSLVLPWPAIEGAAEAVIEWVVKMAPHGQIGILSIFGLMNSLKK